MAHPAATAATAASDPPPSSAPQQQQLPHLPSSNQQTPLDPALEADQSFGESPALADVLEKSFLAARGAVVPSNNGVAPGHDSISTKGDEKDIEKAQVSSQGTTSDDASSQKEQATSSSTVVDWDGPDDPANPQNWANKRKWAVVAVMAALTFATPLGSTIFAPAVPLLMKEFHSDNTLLASFVVSVYILGFVFGPLIVAPMSELYGRVLVTHGSNVLFLAFTIGCAASTNLPMFVVFRFLMGCAGATPLTVGGGVIADLFKQQERGAAMSIWSMGPLIGPIVGPIAGGYLAEAAGWRWVFWLVAILVVVLIAMCLLFLRETYAVTLLERKAKKLRKETGNTSLYSRLDRRETPKQLFWNSIARPMKLLFLSPIVFLLSLHLSVVYGYLYLLFSTVTYVFEDLYGFSTGAAGLVYLGIGLGLMGGIVTTALTSDRILKAKSKNGEMKPEYRLPTLVVGAIIVPIGLFWYAWSAYEHTHWIVPIIGSGVVGLGNLFTFMPVLTYLVDAFPLYAASATAANTVLRSLFAGLVPLAGQPLTLKLGLNWGGSLLAFIAIALIPIPFLFIKYGERLRTNPRFQVKL